MLAPVPEADKAEPMDEDDLLQQVCDAVYWEGQSYKSWSWGHIGIKSHSGIKVTRIHSRKCACPVAEVVSMTEALPLFGCIVGAANCC